MAEKNPDYQKQSPDKKPKSSTRTCCLIGLVMIGLIIAVLAIRSCFGFDESGNNKKAPIPSPNSSPTTNIPQEDILNFFIETTTYNGKMTKRLPVCRWTKNPIKVEIQGDINEKTTLVLDEAIKEFNAVSNIKMEKVTTNSDILVYYMPVDQFPPNSLSEAVKGLAYFDPDNNCVISSAKIYVDDTEFADTKQLTYHDTLLLVTRHEFLHALGFSGHDTKQRGCTALSSVACLTYGYTQYDISAIKMLYNSNLPLCSDETAIREFFANAIPI